MTLILSDVANENSTNLLLWLMAYSPLLLVIPMVVWANRRHRAVRGRLDRIEEKLDQVLLAIKKDRDS